MKAHLFLLFSIIFLLVGCFPSSEKPYNSKATIRYDIKNITAINLDTSKFEVLLDSVYRREGELDNDYIWYVKIKFASQYFDTLKYKIRSSPYFDKVKHFADDNWKNVDTKNLLGVWFIDSVKYEFLKKPRGFEPEPIYLNVDTVSRILDLTLIHI